MIAFVDTSAIDAVLDRDDKESSGSTQDLGCALVQHRLGLEAVRSFQQQIAPVLTIEWVSPAQHDSSMAAVLAAGRKKLSLVDCVSFNLMRQAGIRAAFAFDSHFVEQGFDCRL
jgi:predicted nucleic acid-binding protein